MKFMGSKRAMLLNGLGSILDEEVGRSNRFVDLFCGSAAVAWHIAEHQAKPVLATDIQEFAVVLAQSIVCRTAPFDADLYWQEWSQRALTCLEQSTLLQDARDFENRVWMDDPRGSVDDARAICREANPGTISSAYGGYYFSPLQSLELDALRGSLPEAAEIRPSSLAALIQATAQCSASPGHTAQPFSPTVNASPYLFDAWRRSVSNRTLSCFRSISGRNARKAGAACVSDAADIAASLGPGDLAFVDPPYSSVHYSRFYHVLETIAHGRVSPVSGSGRYPPLTDRPQSDFSVKSRSRVAFEALLSSLAERGVRTVVTFPAQPASNGLSGDAVLEIAESRFVIERTVIHGKFSTLGGNATIRAARKESAELVLVLTPR